MRISLEEALKRIRSTVPPLPSAYLPMEAALGLITAEPLTAFMDQPPFPRSPYDGYALRAEDSAGASEMAPVSLEVVGESFAGSPFPGEVKACQTVRIMTGGAIPQGADCVVMQEKTDMGTEFVRIFQALCPFDNYCHRGEDFKKGDVLAPEGIRVSAALRAVASGAGLEGVRVIPRPLTAVIATGDELRSPGQSLAPGQIYNSNSPYLLSRLTELRIPNLDKGLVQDDLDDLTKALAQAAGTAELVICTGGVSVGQRDLVPAALERLGADILFHGVAVKPGMPAALALLNGRPVLALSGNPFACAVTFELLGRPLLARLAGDVSLEPEVRSGQLAEAFEKRRPVRRFLRGTLSEGAVTLPGEQGNGQLRTMIGCECLAELPPGEEPLPAGTEIKIFMI